MAIRITKEESGFISRWEAFNARGMADKSRDSDEWVTLWLDTELTSLTWEDHYLLANDALARYRSMRNGLCATATQLQRLEYLHRNMARLKARKSGAGMAWVRPENK